MTLENSDASPRDIALPILGKQNRGVVGNTIDRTSRRNGQDQIDALPITHTTVGQMINTARKACGLGRDIVRNRMGRDVLPTILTYTVTFKCSLHCIMCDSPEIELPGGDLNIDEIERIYSGMPEMLAVRLTGGEPFVRRDLGEIATLINKYLKPPSLHLTTNGMHPERVTDFCVQRVKEVCPTLDVLVSMDGDEETHNAVRNREGAYDKALETLTLLAKNRKKLKVNPSVNMTIVDQKSIEAYPKLRDTLAALRVPLKVVFAYPQSAMYEKTRGIDVSPKRGEVPLFGTLTQSQIRAFIPTLLEDSYDMPFAHGLAKRAYLKMIQNRMNGIEQDPHCAALGSHMRIIPNGDVMWCQMNSKVVGNLRNQSFKDLWNSDHRKKGREWVKQCAGCTAECESVSSDALNGKLFEEIKPM